MQISKMKRECSILCLIFAFISDQSNENETKWTDFINKNDELHLSNSRIIETNGLNRFTNLSYVDLSYNELTSLGEIKYLVVSVVRVLGRMDFGYFNTRNYQ